VAQRAKELLHLLRGQYGGRLVKNDETRPQIEGLEDFDPLLFTDRELPDFRIGINVQAVRLREGRHPRAYYVKIETQPARGGTSQGDVLGHCHGRNKHEVLVNHTDSGGDRVRR
jgi:hypothetical protein